MIQKIISIIAIIFISLSLLACDINLNPGQLPGRNFNLEPFERFFDDTKKKTITIEITQQKWLELNQEMLNYHALFKDYRTDFMVEAHMIYEDNEGALSIEKIGFRTRGNVYSRQPLQNENGELQPNHFKISFNRNYNPINVNRTVFELEEIDLKQNKNGDTTYITEKFSLDLFKHIGVYAAHATLVELNIKIGDENHLYGVYTAFEPIDNQFIKRRFEKAENDGPLYKSLWQQFGPANLGYPIRNYAIGIRDEMTNYRPSYDLKTNKKTENHDALKYFIRDINNWSDERFITDIESLFEVDLFLRYLAVGVLLGNPDDYRAMGNNYYLYQTSQSKKWMLIPYDYDHGLGQGWNGEPVFTNWTVGASIYRWGNLNASMLGEPNYPHVLVDRILRIPSYQLQYEVYLRELIEGDFFSVDAFSAMYLQQYVLYNTSIQGALISHSFGLRNIEWYINAKREDVLAQLTYYDEHPNERGV